MKRICNILFFVLLLFVANAGVQAVDSASHVNRTSPRIRYYRPLVSFDLQTGSSTLNASIMRRLALGGYISEKQITAGEKRQNSYNRFGSVITSKILLYPWKFLTENTENKIHLQGISVSQTNLVGGTYSGDLYRLVFQGNAPYAGQKLALNHTRIQQFATRDWKFQFQEIKLDSARKWLFAPSLQVSQLLAFRQLRISDSYLYTDTFLNYLQADLTADFLNSGRNNWLGKGIGAGFSFWLHGQTGPKSSVHFSADNLGVFYVPGVEKNSRNLQNPESGLQSFEKGNLGSAQVYQADIQFKDLSNGSWFISRRDTIWKQMQIDSQKLSGYIPMPFRLSANYSFGKNALSLQYLHIPGYIPRLGFSRTTRIASNNWLRNLFITPSLAIGGFDTWDANLFLAYYNSKIAKKSFGWQVELRGLESWILPGQTHGFGGFASLMIPLQMKSK